MASDRSSSDPNLSGAILARRASGETDSDIVRRLVDRGVTEVDARQLVAETVADRLRSYDKLYKRLRKTEALLDIHRQLRQLSVSSTEVAERDAISPDEFRDEFFIRNAPVVLRGIARHWPAASLWSLDYFRRYSERTVEVMTGRNADPRFELNRDERKTSMLMGEFLDLLERGNATNDFYLVAHNYALRGVLKELCDDFRAIPGILRDPDPGWMNLWLGPQGTITPLHHDNNNILIVQLLGSKRIHLIPSLEIHLLYNKVGSFSEVDPTAPQPEYPLADKATISEIRLNAGDALFLPVAWWHRVESLSTSASVSCSNFVLPNSYVTYNP